MTKLIATLFLTLAATPAFAKDIPWCGLDLLPAPAPARAAHSILTKEQAYAVVGPAEIGNASPQIRKAVAYVLKLRGASFEEKIAHLQILFMAIRDLQLFTWRADKISGPEGSQGFLGEEGHFVILYPDGRLFKGLMQVERDLDDQSHWNGRHQQIQEIKLEGANQQEREAFVTEFVDLIFATEEVNQAWIDRALADLAPSEIHVMIENAWMKKLNDQLIKNKDLVTALTNYHKKLLAEELAALRLRLSVAPYQDFKSTRLILNGADQLRELQEAFVRTNRRFYADPRVRAVVREEDLRENWFRMGVGQSEAQAALAARDARENGGTAGISYFWDPKVSGRFTGALARVKELNTQIIGALAGTPLIVRGELHLDVFAAARKATPQTFLGALKEIFPNAQLNPELAGAILEFCKLADEFSPSVLVAKRELLTIHEAPYGALSIDFIGLGAENLRATAKALIRAKDLNQAVKLTRAFEREVTEEFIRRKELVRSAVSEHFNGQVSLRFSGDDGIIIPERAIDLRDQLHLVQKLAALLSRPYFRMSMISAEGAANPNSSQIITHAESIEKTLRPLLIRGLGAARVDELALQIFIPDTDSKRAVFLIMNGKKKISDAEKKIIRNAFPMAVKLVEEQVRKSGVDVEYDPTEIFAIFGKSPSL